MSGIFILFVCMCLDISCYWCNVSNNCNLAKEYNFRDLIKVCNYLSNIEPTLVLLIAPYLHMYKPTTSRWTISEQRPHLVTVFSPHLVRVISHFKSRTLFCVELASLISTTVDSTTSINFIPYKLYNWYQMYWDGRI